METKFYTVTAVDGEYAYLKEDGEPTAEPIFISLMLLPFGTDVGTRLKCEAFEYELA